MSQCSVEGATDCEVVSSYFNGCIAWVVPTQKQGTRSGRIGYGTTPDRALKEAQERCSEGAACTVLHADCSFAEKY